MVDDLMMQKYSVRQNGFDLPQFWAGKYTMKHVVKKHEKNIAKLPAYRLDPVSIKHPMQNLASLNSN